MKVSVNTIRTAASILNDDVDMKSSAKCVTLITNTPCPCVVCDELRTFGRLLNGDERADRAKRLEANKPSLTKM